MKQGKSLTLAEAEKIIGLCHNALGEHEGSDHESLPEAINTHISERNQRIAELEQQLSDARERYNDASG